MEKSSDYFCNKCSKMKEKDIKIRLKDTMKERKMNIAKLSKVLNINSDRMYAWYRDDTQPKADDRQKLEKWIKEGIGENFNFRESMNDYKLNKERKKTIPFYDAEATAGIMETEMTPISAPSGTIDIGDLLHDSQAAIRIYGNSMLPNYPPGCVVGLTKCRAMFIEPGEVYVIETRDRRLLKRLFYKDDASNSDKFLCYSDNIMKFDGGSRNGKLAYPPFEIPKDEVVNLFVVTGVIKRNANSVIINR